MLNKKFKSVTVNSVEGKVLSEISEREIDSLSDGDVCCAIDEVKQWNRLADLRPMSHLDYSVLQS